MTKAKDNSQYTKLPVHVAIIMDGNGRWAERRGLPRTEGHRKGANRLKEIVNTCLDIGIKYLTVYAFSKENWKRPITEVNTIMKLAEYFFKREFDKFKKKGVFFRHLGDLEGLPPSIRRIIVDMKSNDTPDRNYEDKRLVMNIAFNYSGRSEIIEAVKKISEKVLRGDVKPEEINEELISESMYTAGIPDPDLLIRTGGELRISNFLLWQSAYTEIWVTRTLWPDFTSKLFKKALEDYSKRDRRFGGLNIYHS